MTNTTYYVNCAARSGGDGSTTSKAWRSLATVNAHAAFKPGDQILFKRATTCRGRLHPKGNGARGAPITIGKWGSVGARPTIAGGGTPNFTAAVDLRNQQWWTIQDLHITNTNGRTSTQTYRAGVSIRNQDGGVLPGILVQRLKVENVASAPNEKKGSSREWGGITVAVGGVTGDSFPGLQIRNNVVSHVGRTGIAVMGWEYPTTFNQDLRITGNRVSHARGDGIVIFGAKHARIDHNVVDFAGDEWPCPLCGGITPNTANAGIWPARSSDVQIDHNEVYGMKRLGGDGVAFDADGQTENVVFEYNYAHDNEGGGILFCGSNKAKARFNVLQNNSRGAFIFIGSIPATNTRIYNNTVYTSMKNGSQVVHTQGDGGGKGINFFNNLIYNMGWGYYVWPAPYKSSHNTVVGTHGIGEPRGNGTIFDTAILRGPGNGGNGFKTLSGYHPSSPKDDPRGIAIPKGVTKDFFGNTINPKSPPRGAAIK
ncbi:right-handed parallel beta-helix repeat-containing protein [uncultured Amnibacterium sp.]|uniref:right-handed parallel beta-helix repeat-containing protein n=1 Tax=uncultured Amnibacterium sp. TaxID=1631851 RepID=UPI0035CB8F86